MTSIDIAPFFIVSYALHLSPLSPSFFFCPFSFFISISRLTLIVSLLSHLIALMKKMTETVIEKWKLKWESNSKLKICFMSVAPSVSAQRFLYLKNTYLELWWKQMSMIRSFWRNKIRSLVRVRIVNSCPTSLRYIPRMKLILPFCVVLFKMGLS